MALEMSYACLRVVCLTAFHKQFVQRGFPRPPDGSYDIGALERQANDSDLAPRLYLPLIKR
jgi:hypothetical protein